MRPWVPSNWSTAEISYRGNCKPCPKVGFISIPLPDHMVLFSLHKFHVAGSAVNDRRPNYFCHRNTWLFCHPQNIELFLYVSKCILFLQQTWLCESIYPSFVLKLVGLFTGSCFLKSGIFLLVKKETHMQFHPSTSCCHEKHAASEVCMRSLLFWDVMQRRIIDTYRLSLSLHRTFCSLSNTPTNAHI